MEEQREGLFFVPGVSRKASESRPGVDPRWPSRGAAHRLGRRGQQRPSPPAPASPGRRGRAPSSLTSCLVSRLLRPAVSAPELILSPEGPCRATASPSRGRGGHSPQPGRLSGTRSGTRARRVTHGRRLLLLSPTRGGFGVESAAPPPPPPSREPDAALSPSPSLSLLHFCLVPRTWAWAEAAPRAAAKEIAHGGGDGWGHTGLEAKEVGTGSHLVPAARTQESWGLSLALCT